MEVFLSHQLAVVESHQPDLNELGRALEIGLRGDFHHLYFSVIDLVPLLLRTDAKRGEAQNCPNACPVPTAHQTPFPTDGVDSGPSRGVIGKEFFNAAINIAHV